MSGSEECSLLPTLTVVVLCMIRVRDLIYLYIYEVWTEVIGREWWHAIGRSRRSIRTGRSKLDPDRSVELYDSGRFSTKRQNGTFGRILTDPDRSFFDPPSPKLWLEI